MNIDKLEVFLQEAFEEAEARAHVRITEMLNSGHLTNEEARYLRIALLESDNPWTAVLYGSDEEE